MPARTHARARERATAQARAHLAMCRASPQAMRQEQHLVKMQWRHPTSYNKYVCPHNTNSKDKFDSGVCEKTPISSVAATWNAPAPRPPKFNVVQTGPTDCAEMGVFFAPPECPPGNKINIELGVRGCAISARDSAGWAFFSHTPVTTSMVISVPHGVAFQTRRSPLKQLAIAEFTAQD